MFTSQLNRLFEDFGRIFDDASFQTAQHPGQLACNLWANDKELIAQVEIPGIDPQQLSAHVEKNVLHISAKAPAIEGRSYVKGRARNESVTRRIHLPIEVDEASAKAEYTNGVLQISFKRQVKDTHQIKIKVK